MGCVSTKADINDQYPNMFQVTNVNDQGDLISPGQLEITETELVLYQKGKQPTIWPLRSLRKYGFDSGIFSFECGRRCPTGEGIYAFQCRKAEQLFNIVQQNIVKNSNDDSLPTVGLITNSNDFPVPTVCSGTTVQRSRLTGAHPEGYLNPVLAPLRNFPTPLSRPGSITTTITNNGPVSPTLSSTPLLFPTDFYLEHNNNKKDNDIDHTYTNTNLMETNDVLSSTYANMGINVLPPLTNLNENYVNITENGSRLYMNVDRTTIIEQNPDDDNIHCYANIDTKELEQLRPAIVKTTESSINNLQTTTTYTTTPTPPPPPPPPPLHEVNYAELVLELKCDLNPLQNTTTQYPDNNNSKKSYATIDFQKTNALSQSTNPRMDIEEGSRKTRHNSTIDDITTITTTSATAPTTLTSTTTTTATTITTTTTTAAATTTISRHSSSLSD